MRPRARGCISATPMCGQSGWPGGAVAGHRHEATRIRPDLDIVSGAQHHLQHGPAGGHRPVGRQHPFGVVAAGHPHRQRRHHRHADRPQHRFIADTGQHQQMGRLNCAGAQHDSVSGKADRALRADRVDTHRGGSGEPQSHRSGLRQQRQVGSAQSRDQISRARSDPYTVDDVERDRAHTRKQLRPAVVEVGDPGKPGTLRGSDETFSGTGHFVSAANQDRATVAVGGAGEIQVGLDGAEVVEDVGPRPAGYRRPDRNRVAIRGRSSRR